MTKKVNKKIYRRKTKNMKIMRFIKISTIICFVILVLEILYVGYNLLYNNEQSLYFDGVNAVVRNDKYYVTVGSNNNNDNFYEKAKISLYNHKKEKTFEKLYNVGYNSAFFGVENDDEDNLIVVGSYEKTIEDHDKLIRQALIVKYDKYGNIIFEKDFKKLDNSKFTNVLIYDDFYYVTGQTVYSNTKIGNKVGGALLNKYDKNGKLIWSKLYGNCKNAIYNDLLLKDNYIYVVGTDDNYGLLCKYDLDGNLISTNRIEDTLGFSFNGISEVNNNLYVCGSSRIEADNTEAVIVKFNLDCKYNNKVLYGGNGYGKYNRIIKDEHDNLIAIGLVSTYRKKSHNEIDEFDYDGIIGKYNYNLEKIDVVSYGDESDDYFTDIKLDKNNYLVVGYSSYEDGSYLSKFINYSSALKVLEVE